MEHVGKMADKKERSFIAVKPDGVQRGLVGEIVRRFEVKGFKLVAMKMVMVSRSTGQHSPECMPSLLAPQPPIELLEEHYGELKKKPFFPGLVEFMSTGPVVAMVSAPVEWRLLLPRSAWCVLMCVVALSCRCGRAWAWSRPGGRCLELLIQYVCVWVCTVGVGMYDVWVCSM